MCNIQTSVSLLIGSLTSTFCTLWDYSSCEQVCMSPHDHTSPVGQEYITYNKGKVIKTVKDLPLRYNIWEAASGKLSIYGFSEQTCIQCKTIMKISYIAVQHINCAVVRSHLRRTSKQVHLHSFVWYNHYIRDCFVKLILWFATISLQSDFLCS